MGYRVGEIQAEVWTMVGSSSLVEQYVWII
jgi:hypothetical protein